MFTIELDSSNMREHKRHFWNESSYACSWRVDLFCKHNFELQITFLQLPHISKPPLTSSTARGIDDPLFNPTICKKSECSLTYKSSTIYNSILKYETRPKLYKPKVLKKIPQENFIHSIEQLYWISFFNSKHVLLHCQMRDFLPL